MNISQCVKGQASGGFTVTSVSTADPAAMTFCAETDSDLTTFFFLPSPEL